MKSTFLIVFIFISTLLLAQNSTSGKVINEKKSYSNSHIFLGSINVSGDISKSQLAAVDSVFAEGISTSGEVTKLFVTQYSIIYQPKKGEASFRIIKKSAITPAIKKIFENVQTGDRIIIGRVMTIGNYIMNGSVPLSLTFVVK